MSEDRHARQDPTGRYPEPDRRAGQRPGPPGLESEMRPEPDVGEEALSRRLVEQATALGVMAPPTRGEEGGRS